MRTRSVVFVLAIAGCSSSSTKSPDAAAPLRPGVEDSNEAYKGTPSANETAFWTAVRTADDTGRAAAVDAMKADVAADPSNGYSDFLIGASTFMAPSSVLRALAAGTDPGGGGSTPTAGQPFFEQGLTHLTDPFYLGFDGALLAGIQFAGGDPQALQTVQAAMTNNHVATGFFLTLSDLGSGAPSQALQQVYALLEYCNGGPLAHDGSEAAAYITKANAGAYHQRECYSGYLAPHGSAGLALIVGDIHALNGNAAAARAYYTAATTVTDYATWPLKPVIERRLAPNAVAPSIGEATGIAATCGTCHTSSLP